MVEKEFRVLRTSNDGEDEAEAYGEDDADDDEKGAKDDGEGRGRPRLDAGRAMAPG